VAFRGVLLNVRATFFANVHSNPAPLILGPCLLLPGSVAAFILPNLPTWLLSGIIVAVNALVWWRMSKLGGKAVSE
jgi:hypothetical protein